MDDISVFTCDYDIDEVFEPRDGHRFVEIKIDGAEAAFKEGVLKECEISSWLDGDSAPSAMDPSSSTNSPDTQYHRLRLLILSPREKMGATLLPIPISHLTLQMIQQKWDLPFDFLTAMQHKLPLVTNQASALPCHTIGMTIRSVGAREWQFCTTMRFNTVENHTTAVLCGLRETEVDQFLKYLERTKQDASDPMLVPITAVTLWAADCLAVFRGIGFQNREVCYLIDTQHSSKEALKTTISERPEVDLNEVTRDLSLLSSNLSVSMYSFKHLLKITKLMRSTFEARSTVPGHNRDMAKGIYHQESVEQRTEFLIGLLEGALLGSDHVANELHDSMQIIQSLIAQRDSRLNLEMAESTKRIAEASLRDSASMKAIAEDSKRVALATQKDSASMRLIAAVSVIFLPGTFTATLFSASFFNFRGSGNSVVSPWVWLYSVVTLILTIAVFGAWWVRSKQREQAIDKLYGEEKEKAL